MSTFKEIGDQRGEADSLWSLGDAADEQGWRDKAREQWTYALRIYEEIGSPSAAAVQDLLARSE